ncbi:MAG: PAS domain S-box-containing protein [Crocinitomicaceae bacterium]|jgi:PAS domain S-box-containing protein
MKKLSRQELYAKYLISNSLEFICASDTETKIAEFNPAAERAFGYSKHEMMGLDVSVLYASKEEFERVAEALNRDGNFTGEILNIRKNGELFTSFLSANKIYDTQGNDVGIMGVSRDITKEKDLIAKMEEQYREKTELLKEFKSLSQIATSVMNGIVITDVNGKMRWSNDSFSRITGYSREEMVGHLPSEVFRIPHFYEAEFKELTSGGPRFDEAIQVPHYRKNGEMYWILVESTPVHDEHGNVVEIIEVCTEITDQKNAELALIESEQNFRQISETIRDVFFLYNHFDRSYEYMSPNALEILGMDAESFYADEPFINTMVLEEDRHILRKARLDILNNKSYDVEYRIMVNREMRWIHERAFPIQDSDGRIVKGSGVCSDISTEKHNREVIDLQNKDITESIQYAMLIQEATLPLKSDMDNILPDNFIFYRPKGALSGDFYVVNLVNPEQEILHPAFVVADCTGHGIPGAILSILCSSLIKQSFTNHDVDSPAEALGAIRTQLGRLFTSRNADQMKDGMDVAFCVLNPITKILRFAGANLSCFILRNKEWIELKGDKQHVGYTEDEKPFTHQTFQCEKDDVIYLFTDGFSDQFGGENNKKYLKKRFLKFLLTIGHEPMKDQEELLKREFEKWIGLSEQTDDVCVFGVRIN